MTSSNIRESIWFKPDAKGAIPINEIFNALNAAYPIRWKNHFSNPQAISDWRVIWATALEQEKVTVAQAMHALGLCAAKYAWPPSSAEFIALCQSLPVPQYQKLPAKMTPEQRARALARFRAECARIFGEERT